MTVAPQDSNWQELAAQLGEAREDLLAYCVRLVRDRSEAEDLVQQVFLATLTRSDLDLTRPLLPWMRRVAKHRAIDGYRKNRHEQEPLPSQVPDSNNRDQHQTTEAAHGAAGAWMAVVGSLRPQQRAVLLLRDLLDFSGAETAVAMGVSEGNVKVLLHRARAALTEAAARDPVATRTSYTRAADALLSASPGSDRYELRLLFDAERGATDPRLESHAAWSLWGSLLDAMERSAAHDSPLRVRVLLARIIARRGDVTPAHHAQIAEARQLAMSVDDPRLHADVDLVAGVSHLYAGRQKESRECFQRILDSPVTTQAVRGYAATGLGGVLWRSGRFAEARSVYGMAAELADSPRRRDALLHNVALLDALSGELDSALSRGEEALTNHLAAGRSEDAYETLNALGMALQNHQRLDEAQARFDGALALRAERALPSSEGPALINLGLIAHERGLYADAESLFSRAHTDAMRTGRVRRQGIALANTGVSRHAGADLAGALTAFDAAERVTLACNSPHLLGFILAHRAAARAAAGHAGFPEDLARARALLTEVNEPRMLEVLLALEAVVALHTNAPGADALARQTLNQLDRPTLPSDTHPGALAPTARFAAVRIAVALLQRGRSAHELYSTERTRTGAAS